MDFYYGYWTHQSIDCKMNFQVLSIEFDAQEIMKEHDNLNYSTLYQFHSLVLTSNW